MSVLAEKPCPWHGFSNMNRHFRLSLLTAGVVLLGAGCVRLESSPKPEATDSPAVAPKAESPTTPEAGIPTSPETAPETAVSRPMPAASFPMLAKATRFINENQGKKPGEAGYETIVDLVVPDPDKAGTYYFATSAYDAAKGENFVGVYSMEEVSYVWWRAYKKTYKRGEDGSAPAQLRVIGKEGRTLYLVADKAGTSHDGKAAISDIGPAYSLDLDKPLDGLKEVTSLPASIAGVRL